MCGESILCDLKDRAPLRAADLTWCFFSAGKCVPAKSNELPDVAVMPSRGRARLGGDGRPSRRGLQQHQTLFLCLAAQWASLYGLCHLLGLAARSQRKLPASGRCLPACVQRAHNLCHPQQFNNFFRHQAGFYDEAQVREATEQAAQRFSLRSACMPTECWMRVCRRTQSFVNLVLV